MKQTGTRKIFAWLFTALLLCLGSTACQTDTNGEDGGVIVYFRRADGNPSSFASVKVDESGNLAADDYVGAYRLAYGNVTCALNWYTEPFAYTESGEVPGGNLPYFFGSPISQKFTLYGDIVDAYLFSADPETLMPSGLAFHRRLAASPFVREISAPTKFSSGFYIETLHGARTLAEDGESFAPVYRDCPYLQTVVIPEGIVGVGRGDFPVFENCPALAEVYLPASLAVTQTSRGIRESAFENCPALARLYLPDEASAQRVRAMLTDPALIAMVSVKAK